MEKYLKDGIRRIKRIVFSIFTFLILKANFIDEMHAFQDEVQKKIKKNCFFENIWICLLPQNWENKFFLKI